MRKLIKVQSRPSTSDRTRNSWPSWLNYNEAQPKSQNSPAQDLLCAICRSFQSIRRSEKRRSMRVPLDQVRWCTTHSSTRNVRILSSHVAAWHPAKASSRLANSREFSMSDLKWPDKKCRSPSHGISRHWSSHLRSMEPLLARDHLNLREMQAETNQARNGQLNLIHDMIQQRRHRSTGSESVSGLITFVKVGGSERMRDWIKSRLFSLPLISKTMYFRTNANHSCIHSLTIWTRAMTTTHSLHHRDYQNSGHPIVWHTSSNGLTSSTQPTRTSWSTLPWKSTRVKAGANTESLATQRCRSLCCRAKVAQRYKMTTLKRR